MQHIDLAGRTNVEEVEDAWHDLLASLREGEPCEPAVREELYDAANAVLTRILELSGDGAYLALHGLAIWFQTECTSMDDWSALATVRRALEVFVARSENEDHELLVNGFLEHLLESPEARPEFAAWSQNPRLAILLGQALEWAEWMDQQNEKE